MSPTELPEPYRFRHWQIPVGMMPGLERWATHHVLPGSFLRAVLENNLKEAVGLADDENMANLPAFVGWLYNEAPSPCWGSPEKVAAWAQAGRDKAAASASNE